MNSFYKQLSKGATLITVNRRLAEALHEDYGIYQQSEQQVVWQTPTILSLDNWLESCWQLHDGLLLNDHQAMTLWENIIVESENSASFLHPSDTAQQAHQAWNLLQQWGISCQFEGDLPRDIQVFVNWAETFSERCKRYRWVTRSERTQFLTNHIIAGDFIVPETVLLAGFDQLSPQTERLFNVLTQQGCLVEYLPLNNLAETQQRFEFKDIQEEIYTMARWARMQLANNNKVACIVPNLSTIRSQVEWIFSHVFGSKDFNISAGESLAEFPIIHDALSILSLYHFPIALEHVSGLLRSPFIGGGERELSARMMLDFVLHELGEREITLQTTLAFAKQSDKSYFAPVWAEQIDAYLTVNKHLPTAQLATGWARSFAEQLSLLAWPGDRTLNSSEYQQVQRWQHLLEEFAGLEAVCSQMTLSQAVTQLNQLARRTFFQPESTSEGVQILGLLESGGLSFDRLWVMGLTDTDWPAPVNPNPFIPVRLQRKLGMPHASAEKELQFTQLMMHRFKRSAKHVIFSSAASEEGDRVLHPSALIQDIPVTSNGELQLFAFSPYWQQQETVILEEYNDELGPVVNEHEKIYGGTGIFKEQAACPFRAFARFRLGAHTLNIPSSGLNALERGSLLHEVLQDLWHEIKTHQQLCAQSDEVLKAIIKTSIKKALTKLVKAKPLTVKKRFAKLEEARLETLMREWLALEKKRLPFTVVANEEWQKATIAGITLHMQVDRIDELSDGSRLIIDYKTGYSSIKDWFGERPEQPQLPLYCVLYPQSVDGIVLAQVRKGEMSFKGVSRIDGLIPGVYTPAKLSTYEIPESWGELQIEWKTHLNTLGENFKQGHAEVLPKKAKLTCELCNLQGMCRITEINGRM